MSKAEQTLTYLKTSASSRFWPYLFAVCIHLAAVFLLLLARTSVFASPSISATVGDELLFRLVPPPEGDIPVYMSSANPDVLPPEGKDSIPDAEVQSGGKLNVPSEKLNGDISDADLEQILAAEREALKAELNDLTETAMANPLPRSPMPVAHSRSGDKGASDKGPEGAVRELNLDGFPQPVVDDIMKRYKLRIVTQKVDAGRRGQSFLSSASKGQNEQFFGGMTVPSGIYEVFQLSRDSVARMSVLEEKALRERGLEPLNAKVIHIVFGIVKDDAGHYELGVKSLEAEAISP